tara:strand:- start:8490 stop:9398 length:909 start_codon:yes stop_codon:yes gene_type:complete
MNNTKNKSAIELSIIIPFFNRIDLLNNTLKSFDSIQNNNFEIILVDDGSTENFNNTYNGFLDTKIKYFRIKNSERGYARNYGAHKARGKYLNFFDSDDIVLQNHVNSFIDFAKKNNYPNVFANSYILSDSKKKLNKNIVLNGILNNKIFKKNILSCNSVFIRKDFFLQNKFCENRDLSGSEDWELWLRIASKEKFLGNKVISSIINNHIDRSTIKQNLKKMIKRIDTLEKIILSKRYLVQKNIYYKNVRSEIYSFKSLILSSDKDKRKEAVIYLFNSLFLRPSRFFDKRNLVIFRNIIFSLI